VNLFGYPQSLIKLGKQDSPLSTEAFGIVAGNVCQPAQTKGNYCGKMNIDNSVNVLIYGRSGYGVYFHNPSNANININGVFTLNSFGDDIIGFFSNEV
jgi:hypothetical protein